MTTAATTRQPRQEIWYQFPPLMGRTPPTKERVAPRPPQSSGESSASQDVSTVTEATSDSAENTANEDGPNNRSPRNLTQNSPTTTRLCTIVLMRQEKNPLRSSHLLIVAQRHPPVYLLQPTLPPAPVTSLLLELLTRRMLQPWR
ncbi:hypothetical protein MTO96_016094 [Rhipicephalus appendiculatus]